MKFVFKICHKKATISFLNSQFIITKCIQTPIRFVIFALKNCLLKDVAEINLVISEGNVINNLFTTVNKSTSELVA